MDNKERTDVESGSDIQLPSEGTYFRIYFLFDAYLFKNFKIQKTKVYGSSEHRCVLIENVENMFRSDQCSHIEVFYGEGENKGKMKSEQ